jgi:hypothetical protein
MDEYIKREDALDAVLFALVGTGLQSRALNAIHEVDTADVVPKSEVARDVLSDLKKAIRNKAVYPRYKDSDPYIRLKDVDEIIEDYLKRKTGG